MENKQDPAPPHVLIFPFPAQGHVNSMLKLAELLAFSGLNVTFLNSEYNHKRLVRYTNIQARFSQYPGFHLRSISDGLPDDHPRSSDRIMEMLQSLKLVSKSIFKDLLTRIRPGVNCVIGDGNMGFVVDVACELDIPITRFRTISASCFWAYFSLPQVIEATELPIRDVVATPANFPHCNSEPSFLQAKMENGTNPPPHVLIFPLPCQGHVNSMLKLAELLSLAGINITFLNSEHNHELLVRHTNIEDRFTTYPGFQFQTITDGLPVDHPRSGGRVMEMLPAMKLIAKPIFKKILLETKQPVNCIIADGILGIVGDAALEVGVPILYFRTISACSFWTYFSIFDIIEGGQLPIGGNEDMDRLITKVPGMETFLRCRDLPGFCRVSDMTDPNLLLVMNETRQSTRAKALILNTFEDLEGPILSQIRTQLPEIYSIGPLHELLQAELSVKNEESCQSSSSLWEVDRSCMTWLDNQPEKSVLYVSFGSITVMTRHQLLEFWYGLVNSKKRFLWVIRPDSVAKKDGEFEKIPMELEEGTKERGFIVGWVPQEEVLAHKAIAGFLTHSGWNSTLESIVAGVPMICWPYFADQQVNSRFVGEVWKLGLDMKDQCDREIVEKMVNDLMVERREEFVRSATRMAELARKSVREGGSSYRNLNRLIEDIRLMSVRVHHDI